MSSKKTISALLSAASLAAVLSACGPALYRGPYDNGPDYGRDDDRYERDVQGTVARIDLDGHRIFVDREDDRSLRNGGYGSHEGQAVIYFDDRTRVDYRGRSFRPEDLESGDRIAVNVTESRGRLWAEDIQVLYDVSSGT